MKPKSERRDDKTVQRPDLSGVHGNEPTEETHGEGEHRPDDEIEGGYPGEHGATLPRPQRKR